MFFQTLFVLLQLTLVSQAQFSTYDFEYEEVNLLVKVENWNADGEQYSSFTFEAGEKLFGSNFNWNITALNHDFFEMATVLIFDTREQEYPDRLIQSVTKIVPCDGEVDSSLDYIGPITPDFITGNGFLTIDLEPFVCDNDWIRFAVQFRIYKNSSFIFGRDGIIANEVPFEATRKTLANSSNIDVQFTAGKDFWGKSVTWRLANSDFPSDYEFELVASDFEGGRAFGAGILKIEAQMIGRSYVTSVYIFNLREYKVGIKIPLKLKNLDKADEKNINITRVEFRWETFGLGARFIDYIPYDDDSTPRSEDPRTLLSHVKRIIKN